MTNIIFPVDGNHLFRWPGNILLLSTPLEMKALEIHISQNSGSHSIEKWLEEQPVPVLVEIWSAGNDACKLLEPELMEISREFEGRILTRKIEKESFPSLVSSWEIQKVPALVLWNRGQLVWKMEGLFRLDQISKSISEVLNND